MCIVQDDRKDQTDVVFTSSNANCLERYLTDIELLFVP